MNKLLAIALVTISTLIILPQAAQAGPSLNITYKSGHSACGCPIYTQRIVTGWDSCRRPIYRYVALPVSHRCGHHHVVRPILRTSSCSPRIVPTCRTWTYSSRSRCLPIIPRTCHSRPIIRIRTHCR